MTEAISKAVALLPELQRQEQEYKTHYKHVISFSIGELKTLIAALSELQGVAEGRDVIVPKEPTDEMIAQGLASTAVHHNIEGSGLTVAREKMRIRFRAMISKAQEK